jgi:hypothetical protein
MHRLNFTWNRYDSQSGRNGLPYSKLLGQSGKSRSVSTPTSVCSPCQCRLLEPELESSFDLPFDLSFLFAACHRSAISFPSGSSPNVRITRCTNCRAFAGAFAGAAGGPVEYALVIGQPKMVVIAESVVMALVIGGGGDDSCGGGGDGRVDRDCRVGGVYSGAAASCCCGGGVRK